MCFLPFSRLLMVSQGHVTSGANQLQQKTRLIKDLKTWYTTFSSTFLLMTQKPYIPVGEVQDDMASASMGLEVTMLQQSPRQLALDIYLE